MNPKAPKEFKVRATVVNPLPGQRLTLLPLPAGLQSVDGPASKEVPHIAGSSTAAVTWQIRLNEAGSLPVRVASTTGVVQSFTITIAVQRPAARAGELFGGK
jgi:hypothetical protein